MVLEIVSFAILAGTGFALSAWLRKARLHVAFKLLVYCVVAYGITLGFQRLGLFFFAPDDGSVASHAISLAVGFQWFVFAVGSLLLGTVVSFIPFRALAKK